MLQAWVRLSTVTALQRALRHSVTPIKRSTVVILASRGNWVTLQLIYWWLDLRMLARTLLLTR